MNALLASLTLALVFASFVISASAGLGGSLLMVPTLVLALGPKEGVALAALLLASNNVFKVAGYRKSIPWRASALIVGSLVAGAAIGARLLVNSSTTVVGVAVLASFAVTLVLERHDIRPGQRIAGPALAFTAGATSGFSGTSGPLKGVAIRNLSLDRPHFVGAASLASFAGDATKVAVFTDAELLSRTSFTLAALGRHLNGRIDERGFAMLFWSVMAGYSVRLVTIII